MTIISRKDNPQSRKTSPEAIPFASGETFYNSLCSHLFFRDVFFIPWYYMVTSKKHGTKNKTFSRWC